MGKTWYSWSWTTKVGKSIKKKDTKFKIEEGPIKIFKNFFLQDLSSLDDEEQERENDGYGRRFQAHYGERREGLTK